MPLKIGAWTQPVDPLGLDYVRETERLDVESTRRREAWKNR